jgi:hypothetical protein
MRVRTVFIVVLALILFFTFGPALIAVVSQLIAEGVFGCKVDIHRVIPCLIGGKDYGQMFYDLGFAIWYSYLSLPIGGVMLAVWAVAAAVAFAVSLRRKRNIEARPC